MAKKLPTTNYQLPSTATKSLLAIVGPTASGKTGLALELAKLTDVEIICADSRTIYKGMDIGTAKPSKLEQQAVPHHCLDLLRPDQPYSAAEFKQTAQKLIGEIVQRGNLPVLVGGTGLYVYAVMYDYSFPAGPNNELRRELEGRTVNELAGMLKELDRQTYEQIDLKNPRRLIRAIETVGVQKTKSELRSGHTIIGLNPSMETLETRIKLRTNQMLEDGLMDEVKDLKAQYGQANEAIQSVGYKEILDHLDGKTTLATATEFINLHTRQLAKRQMTWFKRNQDIRWFEDQESAKEYISKHLK